MNVKEAVQAAKKYATDIFSEEHISNLGLEEVEKDSSNRLWKITLGLSRPWNASRSITSMISGEDASQKRVYKVFYVSDETGDVSRVEMRAPVSE